MNNVLPKAHWNPSVEETRPYITAVVAALLAHNVKVTESWLDPFYPDPRDATIRIAGGDALVWNEEQGWLRGTFVGGEQGVRSVLADSAGLADKVMPTPAELVGNYLKAVRTEIRVYPGHADDDDRWRRRPLGEVGRCA